ncbi:hypothetical protein BDF20DRAFT_835100 [Mycotypha africana]|uniref:uncharacterized protein n=1 Tax=Mycotypha africana TaxID=64632 RepID=UPI002301A178|nr:uncharacterized protein BDF20DRAFT_835100 [Mycotypha africana]KAI8982480.1 hypothetical protein BDF20DRAFT_835100 [Mycotypha africana]
MRIIKFHGQLRNYLVKGLHSARNMMEDGRIKKDKETALVMELIDDLLFTIRSLAIVDGHKDDYYLRIVKGCMNISTVVLEKSIFNTTSILRLEQAKVSISRNNLFTINRFKSAFSYISVVRVACGFAKRNSSVQWKGDWSSKS